METVKMYSSCHSNFFTYGFFVPSNIPKLNVTPNIYDDLYESFEGKKSISKKCGNLAFFQSPI
jgi:hypothetical protein